MYNCDFILDFELSDKCFDLTMLCFSIRSFASNV